MTSKITSFIAAGEGARAKKLATAVMEDIRFEPLEVNSEIPVDVQFSINPGWGEYGKPKVVFQEPINIFNVELKECSDYIASALGKDGHLYQQVLSMRESGHPGVVAVLGDDSDINDVIKASLVTRYRGQELGYQIASYNDRLFDFEANSHALGVPVFRLKSSPWKRILSIAHKVLTGGSLIGHAGHPADGERVMAAANLLLRGFGPKLLSPFLEEYTVGFFPKGDYAKPIEELPGWGKKRVAQVSPMIRMVYANRVKA
jgi:hypothetical protein